MAPFSTHLEKRHRITLNEFRVLMLVGRSGNVASHELARDIGVNTMAISRAVAAMSTRGLIEAATDPRSRRRKLLSLTAEGRALYDEMHPSTLKVANYLFAALHPHEVLAFNHYVETLTERLEAEDGAGASVFLRETRPDALEG